MTVTGCMASTMSDEQVTNPADATQGKKPPRTTFKKFVKYFKDQANNQNSSTLYLSPRGLEPGHQYFTTRRSVPLDGVRLYTEDSRRFSEATTYVDNNGRRFLYHHQPSLPAVQSSREASPHGSSGSSRKMAPDSIKHQYASDNIFQSYEVYIPTSASSNTEQDSDLRAKRSTNLKSIKYWLVYIHGGYFRDVKVDSTSFKHAVSLLDSSHSSSSSSSSSLSSSLQPSSELASGGNSSSNSTIQQDNNDIRDRIAGYASINYRLSPHPAYPQDDKTPNYELRNARWPDQINDVLAALRHMQKRYKFGEDGQDEYILIGHSVGATLALLAALNSGEKDEQRAIDGSGVNAPRCVVGVSGIYDFPLIHKTNPGYEAMTGNAMDKSKYEEASPALHETREYEQAWKIAGAGTKSVVLAHSRDDGLVDWSQVDAMKEKLEQSKNNNVRTNVLELIGKHNDIWENGKELARAVREGLEMASIDERA